MGVNLIYVEQEPVSGIGHALSCCKKALGQKAFLLVYGDVLSDGNIFTPALATYSETGSDLAVVTLPASSKEYGNVYLDHEMKIRRLVEKPRDHLHSNYVFAGVFVLSSSIFELLDANNNDMEACYQGLIASSGLQATLWEGGWMDIIYPWHILEANTMIMDSWKEARIHTSAVLEGQVHIEGAVVIEENVKIAAGCILRGPCYIGENSYIGNNTLIREYTSVGPDSVIGYGSELKQCVLFGKSDIGRLSFIGESVLGVKVRLGSGVTTVNHYPDYAPIECKLPIGNTDTTRTRLGSFFGDHVSIGARHTLAPGTIIQHHQQISDNISLS